MRILMLSHGYPPTLSGVSLVVQKLARAMVSRGHAVTVIAASDNGKPYTHEDEGVQVVRVFSWPNPLWKAGRIPFMSHGRLERILSEFAPHVVHSHDPGLLSRRALGLRDQAGAPLVLTCQWFPRFITTYLPFDGSVRRLVEAVAWKYSLWFVNQFDHVVFSTSTQSQAYIERDLRPPVTIISNGLDTTRYHPSDVIGEELDTKYDLPPGKRILFVSRLARDKEIDVLIRAMSRVAAEEQATLLLVGQGDDRPRLESLTEELGLRHYVRFLGFVPEGDLPELYRHSDVFAIASQCEVQSIPTLQAAATGLPIVAARAGALPELVHDGSDGLLVPPGDPEAMGVALLKVLQDPKLAHAMGQVSLSIGRKHAESATFDAYEALYHRIVSS